MRGFIAGLVVLGACAAEPTARTVSTGDAAAGPEDAGLDRDAGPPRVRPDGGPILPPSDDTLELPYGAPAVTVALLGEASLGVLDVQLSVDTSKSIDREIDELQRDLTGRILPELRAVVSELSVGVSRFEDFPLPPFGNAESRGQRADRPFELLTPITSNEAQIAEAVASLDRPLGIGGDIPEAGAEALYQIATGAGFAVGREELIEPWDRKPAVGGGDVGGVGFRAGALHVVLHVTDAPTHLPSDYDEFFPGTRSLEEAAEALQAIDARVVGIVSGACARRGRPCNAGPVAQARRELEYLAFTTGAVTDPVGGACPHGVDGAEHDPYEGVCPLVFDASDAGEGIARTFTDAVATLVDGIRFERVTAFAADDPLGFVQAVRPVAHGDDAPEIADLLPRGAPDGEPDTFVDVRFAAPLEFEVTLRNERLAPRATAQSFRVVLRILGDDLIVRERTLRVVVPAGELPIPDPSSDQDGGR